MKDWSTVWYYEKTIVTSPTNFTQHTLTCVWEQVGTSSVVYPAAGFAPMLAARGVPVAEFNLESTPATGSMK